MSGGSNRRAAMLAPMAIAAHAAAGRMPGAGVGLSVSGGLLSRHVSVAKPRFATGRGSSRPSGRAGPHANTLGAKARRVRGASGPERTV
jgi:hypothetical protein